MRNLHIPGRSNVIGMNGMVATSQPLSTLEAISILQKGGNAVDAAIAASAVQAVIEPNSTGIGGDCFALVSIKGKKPIAVNGSGIAPKKATLDFFESNKINKISTTSPHSVTIPGAIHAWHQFVLRVRDRNSFIDHLSTHNISTGIHYPIPCHLQPIFADHPQGKEGTFPFTERLCEEIVSIPVFPLLTDEEVERVIKAVSSFRTI